MGLILGNFLKESLQHHCVPYFLHFFPLNTSHYNKKHKGTYSCRKKYPYQLISRGETPDTLIHSEKPVHNDCTDNIGNNYSPIPHKIIWFNSFYLKIKSDP